MKGTEMKVVDVSAANMMGADMKAGASTQAGGQANIRDTKRGANIKNRPAIIAGNGPSLARIDYTRLPQEFDVYRCNQFYFEEKYYLGKRVQGVLFHPDIFYEQYYTLKNLEMRGEYEFGEIYCNRMFGGVGIMHSDPNFFDNMYSDAMETYRLVKNFPEIHAFLRYHDLYFDKCPTTGIVMALLAAINGYKEMHLIGIDFYENGDYAFDFKKKNIVKLMPGFKKQAATRYHSKELELKTIDLIQRYFDLKLYSLGLDEGSLGLPKSPVVNSGFILEDKPLDSIKDIMIPERPKAYRATGLLAEVHQKVHQNIFKRLYLDTKRVFSKLFGKCLK